MKNFTMPENKTTTTSEERIEFGYAMADAIAHGEFSSSWNREKKLLMIGLPKEGRIEPDESTMQRGDITTEARALAISLVNEAEELDTLRAEFLTSRKKFFDCKERVEILRVTLCDQIFGVAFDPEKEDLAEKWPADIKDLIEKHIKVAEEPIKEIPIVAEIVPVKEKKRGAPHCKKCNALKKNSGHPCLECAKKAEPQLAPKESVDFGAMKKVIAEAKPDLKEDSREFRAALFIIASIQVGTTIAAIREFTMLPLNTINDCLFYGRNSKLIGGSKNYSDWKSPKDELFWKDVQVLCGYLFPIGDGKFKIWGIDEGGRGDVAHSHGNHPPAFPIISDVEVAIPQSEVIPTANRSKPHPETDEAKLSIRERNALARMTEL